MVVAFIPVRGGSKSIPKKNIKLFCGKPLIYWNLKTLEKVGSVNEVIVATDSDEIETTVRSFNFRKVKIYRRSVENASDVASTESVMLEYINQANFKKEDLFILVQVTSPLTQIQHFDEAIDIYFKEGYDSLLTCVRNYRFFWNEEGTSKNYDFKNRPRRQDFKGQLMENGAFYINRVKNILETQNRLSGKIGIYEMPEYTGMEIDEADDWMIMESLMRKHILQKKDTTKKIKLFLCDVDGVLTDAGMYYSENGDELKKFNTRDGMGFQLLREAGIKTGIITSESTKIVENRAKKLKIDYLYQGKCEGGKLAAAKEICQKERIDLTEVAYIGDDINCFDLLNNVGLKACPANAAIEIKSIPEILILDQLGGNGVVRELAERILRKNGNEH